MRRVVAALAVAAVGLLAGAAAQGRPLPDEDALFAAVRENLARANREQNQYAYKERRTELHVNPFGRLGTGEVHLYEYTPGPTPQVYFRKLLARDGKPVADSRNERQNRRPSSGRSLEDVVATLQFRMDRRETMNGRDVIVVAFEPRPGAKPRTRQGQVAKVMKGTVWIDEAAREVMRMEGTAMDDVSFGLGLIARLHEGAVLSATREPVEGNLWLPTSIRMKGDGRALLFRRLNFDFAIEWFDYRKISAPAEKADAGRK